MDARLLVTAISGAIAVLLLSGITPTTAATPTTSATRAESATPTTSATRAESATPATSAAPATSATPAAGTEKVEDRAELLFHNVTLFTNETYHAWVYATSNEPLVSARVEMRFDARGIASLAGVRADTRGCATQANVVTCRRTVDLGPSLNYFVPIAITTRGTTGQGSVTITGSVNGVSVEPITGTITVVPSPKLIPIGTKVSAPGKTKVKIKVGVKNTGTSAAVVGQSGPPCPAPLPFPWCPPTGEPWPEDTHDVHIDFTDRHLFAESASRSCFPYGPYLPGFQYGWGWLNPGEASFSKYSCARDRLEPGQTTWYEVVFKVSPEHPLATAIITVHDPVTGREVPADIVIDTRKVATLPVTGPGTQSIATAGISLLISGAVLLVLVRRVRRVRRRGD